MTTRVPDEMPLVTIRDAVVFPGAVLPLDIARPRSLAGVAHALSQQPPLFVVATQRDARTGDPTLDGLYEVACAVVVLKATRETREESGALSVIVQGVARVGLLDVSLRGAWIAAKVRHPPPDPELTDAQRALGEKVRERAKLLVERLGMPPDAKALLDQIRGLGDVADIVSANLVMPLDVKIELLGTRLPERLELLLERIEIELGALRTRGGP